MGRHTREFQRRWSAAHPETDLQLVRVNSPTGGLAEGLCDVAVLRAPPDRGRSDGDRSDGDQFASARFASARFASARFDSAVVGWERRYLAVAADDPWARRRSVTLAEAAGRTVVIDRRTGTTTPDLWPPGSRPELLDTRDVDDWLAIIAAGGGVGITPEGTTSQYRRDGVVFRPLRDAPPIAVRLHWRRHDPHPATFAAVALLTELYQAERGSRAGGASGAGGRTRSE
jgi:DNA-binding transcriptional LysR family regulator